MDSLSSSIPETSSLTAMFPLAENQCTDGVCMIAPSFLEGLRLGRPRSNGSVEFNGMPLSGSREDS